MAIFLIILAILLWCVSIWALASRPTIAPAISYLALLVLSFAQRNGFPLVPVNNTILISWLCMTLVVTFACYLQPDKVVAQTRGMGYMIAGAIVGLAVGLLGFSFSSNPGLLYTIMILGVICGIFFGFLLYSNTPDGRPVAIGSGNFFRYLLAKGFPVAITVMQIGIALVIVIAKSVSY